jgi:hypothetical protein
VTVHSMVLLVRMLSEGRRVAEIDTYSLQCGERERGVSSGALLSAAPLTVHRTARAARR